MAHIHDPAGFPDDLDQAAPNTGHDRVKCPRCGKEFGTLPHHLRACQQEVDDG